MLHPDRRNDYTSTHIHSSVRLVDQTRGHVQLSTYISAKPQMDVIHLEVSGMLLLALPKCIAVAQRMAVPDVLLCDFHTSHLTKQYSRRISSEQFPSTSFVRWYLIFRCLVDGEKATCVGMSTRLIPRDEVPWR